MIRCIRRVDGVGVGSFELCLGERRLAWAGGLLITVQIGVGLQQLNAAPVPMHIAEPADVHEDVEAEAVSRTEGPQKLIMASAMLRPQSNQLAKLRRGQFSDVAAKLAIGVMAIR